MNRQSMEKLIDTSPTIESLPKQILQKILGYLPVKDRIRAERVCKRWKNISTKEVWKDVQILQVSVQDDKEYIKIDLIRKIIGIPFVSYHAERIESIKLRSKKPFANVNESRIIQSLLSRSGKNVRKLILNISLSNETSRPILLIIATYCHNIEDIEFDPLIMRSGEYYPVSEFDAFLWLLKVNNQLHSVTCFYAAKVVEILPLKNWKSLRIGNFRGMTREWQDKLIALIKNSPSLENLELRSWTNSILAATSECKQLKTLTLRNWFPESVQNDMTIEIPLMNNLKKLQCLFSFSGQEGWEKKSIALIKNSPSLEVLELPHFKTNILAATSRCKQLKSLKITKWIRGEDEDDMTLETHLLNSLKYLEWSFMDSDGADDDRLIDLLRHHCINLEELHLRYIGCYRRRRSHEVERAILALPKLTSLELANIPITDKKLSSFGKFKYLRFGNIAKCTENGIFEMIMNSECLEELDYPEKMTFELLERLVENTKERRKILKINVYKVSERMLNLCKNSKIQLIPM